ncbi:Peroxisome assembly protein 12 [Dissostichus eleginoides]|uniref:Peroxisome assembly protein 12 n=1 Tax=Dissostichus eleginoides TaxID=100907 RepID=A0AAD9B5J8_DISEL|nr:Peroxisome assembly protein 12 [Dissostichus eleginoides]
MAEAGAHLTSSGSSVSEQPSVFEVLAQESLMEAVRPALRHAVKVLAESNPSRFSFLFRFYDELFLFLDLMLQNHFLSVSSASFSENFYGLKRVCSAAARSPAPQFPVSLFLNRKSYWRSLLLLCVAPYLRVKLEAVLARQRDEEDFSIRLDQSRVQRMRRAVLVLFPFVGGAWRGAAFIQQLLYLFGATKTQNPLLWLAGVRLARLSGDDLKELELRSRRGERLEGGSVLQRACWVMSRGVRGVALSLSSSLSLGVFFLQFLDWFYSSENQNAVKSLTSFPAPPPPLHLKLDPSANQSAEIEPSANRMCPLCRRVRSNSTVLSTSGFVFCYRCIFSFVKNQRRCPVSGFPSEPQHLIKIYSPET